VAVLAACALIAAPALCGSASGADVSAFGGLYRADAFAAFAKLLIYVGAGVTLIVAPAFFERAVDAGRIPDPGAVRGAGHGDHGLGDRPAHALHRSRTQQLASYVLASILRNDDRSAESGLKYFVLGSLASGILLLV
jgi:NADH-quinone oxidoreductase subunit N